MFGNQIAVIALPLAAVLVLHIRPGVVGVLLGVGAVGGLLGAVATKRIAARIGAGWTLVAGALLLLPTPGTGVPAPDAA